jgi:hypothetical protein
VAEDPDLDAGPARRSKPLFGEAGATTDTRKVTAAAVGTEKDGSVLLDIGLVSGVGVGSEFISATPDAKGERIKLRLLDGRGLARSDAMVVSPPGAKVAIGEIFELTRLVPADSNPLRFWLGSTNLPGVEIWAAAGEVKRAGIEIVSDPVEETYTDILSWSGSEWTVEHADSVTQARESTKLGPRLRAETLKRAVRANAKLWVNFPPRASLRRA